MMRNICITALFLLAGFGEVQSQYRTDAARTSGSKQEAPSFEQTIEWLQDNMSSSYYGPAEVTHEQGGKTTSRRSVVAKLVGYKDGWLTVQFHHRWQSGQ